MNSKERFESSLRLIVKSSIFVLFGLILSKLFTYGNKVILAKYFGPETYGLFSLATMILLLFIYLFAFGLPEGILRFSALYKGRNQTYKTKYILKFLLIFLFFSGLLGSLALFYLSSSISNSIFHNQNLIPYLRGFSIIIPFYICLNVFLSLLRSYQKIGHYSFLLNIFQPGLNITFLIIFIIIGYHNPIILAYILSIFIAFLTALLICRKILFKEFERKTLTNKVKKESILDLFSYSWPLVFSAMLANLFSWMDSFFVGYFKTVTDVGYYNVATTLSNLFSLTPAILMSIFYPLAIREFAKNRIGLIKDISEHLTKWILIVNLPLFIIVVLFPGAIINLLFGSAYLVAENALRILAVGALVMSILTISVDLISMKGKSKTILINIIIVSIVNLILNFILVPRYGIDGAAVSASISLIILGTVLTFESRRFLSIFPFNKSRMFRILLVSIVSSLVLIFTRNILSKSLISLFLQGAFFLLVYFGLILMSGTLDKNDYQIIKLIINKIRRK